MAGEASSMAPGPLVRSTGFRDSKAVLFKLSDGPSPSSRWMSCLFPRESSRDSDLNDDIGSPEPALHAPMELQAKCLWFLIS